MNWRQSLSHALSVVRPALPLIVLSGFGMAFVTGGVWGPWLVPIALACILIQIIVFGQITARLISGRTSESVGILKEHLLNYLMAGLVIGAPLLVLRWLLAKLAPSLIAYVFWRAIAQAAVAVITIYVLPLVFLERRSVPSVAAGISFVGRNFEPVGWVAGVIAIAHVLRGVAYLIHRISPSELSFVLILLAGLFVSISFALSFAAALSVVLERRELAEFNA